MSVDLAGGHLVTFVLGELRPVISAHPRFRNNDGQTVSAFANLLAYNDLTLAVSNVRSNGDKQSPDHFMTTVLGLACYAKLDGMPGTFIEWVQENRGDDVLPDPGLYYFAVDAIDESTRDMRLIMQQYRWREGMVYPGVGSIIHLRSDLPVEIVTPVDPTIELVAQATTLYLRTYTPNLILKRTDDNTVLIPGVDWWLIAEERHMVVQSTVGGQQDGIVLPDGWINLSLVDQDGYELRWGIDWKMTGESTAQLSPWTGPGATIYAVGTWKRSSLEAPVVNPENLITVESDPDNPLVLDQCSYTLQRGTYGAEDILWLDKTTMAVKHLMDPGDRLRWELRTKLPQVFIAAKKMAVNRDVIPGLDMAIGDQVVVGDRMAVMVFPNRCEVYEVFGAKDEVSFDIIIKSNDLTTTTELGVLVRNYLLITARDRLESAGLTINKISSAYQGEGDPSGTKSVHTVTLSVTALGDWELHKPLINRVDSVELVTTTPLDSAPGKPAFLPRMVAFGINRFTPAYQ